MKPELPAVLRQLHHLMEALPSRDAGAVGSRILDRLERDLLPRTVGHQPYLVVGIVGPNNAGKSALFNGLCGTALSPSLATGGATRRLFGAANPELLARLAGEKTLSHFPLRQVTSPESAATEVLETALEPNELLAMSVPGLPEQILLIDTPDFDSIHKQNRFVSESLLAVADIAVVVVTRHCYQNREVIDFLEGWLAHGRPWMLVYNEATDESIARNHAQKIAEDLGSPPVAVFWAPHDLSVQEAKTPLTPRLLPMDMWVAQLPSELNGALNSLDASGSRLDHLLHDLSQVARIKEQALEASLAQLCDDLEVLIGELQQQAHRAQDVLEVAEHHARSAGEEIASTAMPGGPFIEAFRDVLDGRTNPVSRGWRSGVRGIRLGIEKLPRAIRRKKRTPVLTEQQSLLKVELEILQRAWPRFWENIVRDLGAEARHPVRKHSSLAINELLDQDLQPQLLRNALDRTGRNLENTPVDFTHFRQACKDLIDQAIQDRGRDWDIQLFTDLAMLAPVATATVVVFATGGLFADLAVAGGGAFTSMFMDRFSHLLGSGITREARRSWSQMRGRQLADLLLHGTLPQSAPYLQQQLKQNQTNALDLSSLLQELK